MTRPLLQSDSLIDPVRFIFGHAAKLMRTGPQSHNWKGGTTKNHGYIKILKPEHPRADSSGYVREHILIAERILGRALPADVEVHHVNEIRSDNRNRNLVICENSSYHRLLHKRKRAMLAGFPPNWRKCRYCKRYDDPANLRGIFVNNRMAFHLECALIDSRLRHAKTRKMKTL